MRNMFVARPLWMRIRRSKDMSLEQQKLHFFKSVPFFESLNYKQIGLVARIVHERHYSPNEYIFELNQPGAALFMIQSGEVVVEIPLDNGEMGEVAILSDGDFLGELALIDNLPRSASARVVKYTRAFALFRNDLLSLVRTHPEIACEIYRALALIIGDRLKATNKLLGQRHEEQRKAA